MAATKPLGILAGGGPLPALAAQAVARHRPVVGVQLAESGQQGLARYCATSTTLSIGKAGAVMEFLKGQGVRDVLMLGKVDKQLNFVDLDFDALALSMLARLANRQDMSIFGAVADELRAQGMRVVKQTQVLADWLAPEGHLAGPWPSDEIARDVALGFDVAKALAGYDVGQTVAVKSGAVVAVEAFEHTDACLRRAAKLAGAGIVACKAARPKQDPRFDVPTIGLATMRVLGRAKAKALAIEAGACFIMDQEKTYAAAADLGISLIGVSQVR
jgi:UDP-2,3-diacylglucosamine hydrolase